MVWKASGQLVILCIRVVSQGHFENEHKSTGLMYDLHVFHKPESYNFLLDSLFNTLQSFYSFMDPEHNLLWYEAILEQDVYKRGGGELKDDMMTMERGGGLEAPWKWWWHLWPVPVIRWSFREPISTMLDSWRMEHWGKTFIIHGAKRRVKWQGKMNKN